MDFEFIIDANNNDRDGGGFGEKMEESLEMTPGNLQKKIWRLD